MTSSGGVGGGGLGGGRRPNKGRYGCVGPGIRLFRGQFLPGHQDLGGKFCPSIRFLEIFDKKCVIFDKRVKKVTYLLKNSNFGTLRFMQTCSEIRVLATFLPAH